WRSGARLGASALVGVILRLQEPQSLVRAQRGEMLRGADHDLRDPDLAGLLERAYEQAIGLLRPLGRQEVVRLAEVDGIDLLEVDEIEDVDGMSQLDVEPVEILIL